MKEHSYKKIELVGTSRNSMEDAVKNAISTSNQTLRNLRWFEVDEIRGSLENGAVAEWQVGIKLAFTIDQNKQPSGPPGEEAK